MVLCSRFESTPDTTSQTLLQHMKQTFSERFDTGKIAILSLPRSSEALAVNSDTGERVLNEEEGYALKGCLLYTSRCV